MKRRSFLKGAAVGAGVGAATIAAPAIAQSNPAISWRMATSWPKSLDTMYGGSDLFCKRVAELTDGKFQIRPFAAGEIVPAAQVLDSVQAGTVEIGHTAPTYYFGKDPAFAFGTTVPFGMNARQNYAWWHFGGGAELMEPLFKGYGVLNIPAGNTGAQMGGWFRKEIKSLKDFKGLKFRIAGIAGLVVAKIGGVPQMIGGPDIYPALEKGTIDAAEWVGPYDDEKLGFNKVAKYYYYPGWWEGGPMLSAMVNLKKWNELPKHYRSALQVAAAEGYSWMPARYDALNPAALRRLVANGTVLKPFPRAVIEACEKATYEVYEELGQKSAHWKRIYPQWRKFRDDEFLWYRVADNAYDNYAFSSKVKPAK
ncbi:MAG: twin-arginine translocation signal domain-containing protein [Betaproteobacteria bacterium]|nr:twin-arginine translocation signal domain-containing protein [Betaproteobacteria bacterium]